MPLSLSGPGCWDSLDSTTVGPFLGKGLSSQLGAQPARPEFALVHPQGETHSACWLRSRRGTGDNRSAKSFWVNGRPKGRATDGGLAAAFGGLRSLPSVAYGNMAFLSGVLRSQGLEKPAGQVREMYSLDFSLTACRILR